MSATNPASETVAKFAAVARPIILAFFEPNCCVAASRITIEVLRRFGVEAVAVPVSMVVEVKARETAFVAGLDMKNRATGIRPAKDPWCGHVIVIGGGHLIDPSFDQCSMPEYGVRVPPFIVAVPLGNPGIEPGNIAATLSLVTDAGETLDVRYWPLRDESFRDAPAWETDHLQPAIELICDAMRAEGRE